MDDGYAIVPRAVAGAEIDQIAGALGGAALQRSRAGARHLLSVPAVARIARDQRLMAMAGDVLGTEPTPFGATLFDKSAQANWLVAWHQDKALPLVERGEAVGWGPWSEKGGVPYAIAPASALAKVVALRLHLDDSTLENGPLRVLPGTHKLGVLSEEQMDDAARRIEAVTCTVERGGVVMMRPLLVHASSKIRVAASRRVLHFEYSAVTSFEDGLRLRT